MIASGDPRVVMFRTKGLRVHRRWTGQNAEEVVAERLVRSLVWRGSHRSIEGMKRDMTVSTSFPASGCRTVGESRRGNNGV